jgi:rhodanese-related sulfurtransferase
LATSILPQSGFKNVFYLSGGFTEWKDENNGTASAGDPSSFSDQAKVNFIKGDDLKKAIDNNEDLLIIDLRKEAAFSGGHIKNAINIYLGDLEKRRSEIPLGKKVVLVDNDGLWAFQGAVRLFDAGVFNVFALSEGLDAWKQKGYEVVK